MYSSSFHIGKKTVSRAKCGRPRPRQGTGTVDADGGHQARRPPVEAGDHRRRRDRAAAAIEGQVVRTPTLPSATLSAITGAAALAEVREPAVHLLVQGPRRPLPAPAAHARASGRGASSPCPPATTPRASPTTPPGSASRPRSSCPASTPNVKVAQHRGARRHGRAPRRRPRRAAALADGAAADARAWCGCRPTTTRSIIAGQGTVRPGDARRRPRPRRPRGARRRWRAAVRHGRRRPPTWRPDIEIIGVQSELYPSMSTP